MKIFGFSLLSLSVLLVLTIFSPVLKASDWDKATTTTFDNPVAIPGQVLPPGTYVFKTLDSALAENMIQIWNADQTQLVATLHVMTDHVSRPYDNPIFNIEQSAAGSTPRLQSWFYPGDVNGFGFDYSESSIER